MSRRTCTCCSDKVSSRKPGRFLLGCSVIAGIIALGAAASHLHPAGSTAGDQVPAVVLDPPRSFTLTMGGIAWACTATGEVITCTRLRASPPGTSRFHA